MVPLTNWEGVSFDQKPSNPKFSWTVSEFSKLKDHCYVLNKFLIGGRNWVLKLYPKGSTTSAYSKSLSFFLYFADGETMKAGEMIYLRADLRILDPFGSSHVKRNFMSLAKLEEAYLDKKGSLKVEIEFEVVSTTKYSP